MAGLLDFLNLPDAGGDMGGLLSGIGKFAGSNSNALIGLGAGIAGGGKNWNEAVGRGLQGFQQGRQQDQHQVQQQQMLQGLIAQGIHPQIAQMAAQNPEVLKAVLPMMMPKNEFHNVDNRMVSFNPYQPAQTRVIGDVPKFEAKEFGQQYGAFDPRSGQFSPQGISPKFEKLNPGEVGGYPTPPQPGMPSAPAPGAPQPGSTAPIVPNVVPTVPMRPSAGGFAQVASGGPEKAPPGYDYADPNDPKKGLVATRGGPATQLPGESAGRLAMLESSRPNLDIARKYFLNPEFDKWKNYPAQVFQQNTGSYDLGQQQRAVKLAAEAALRIATGANAPPSEVLAYADFYIPKIHDSAATRKQKLDALARFQDQAIANYRQGRTSDLRYETYAGAPAAAAPAPKQFTDRAPAGDPLGIR